jgi:uncharacterized protein YjbI with pentapeptide repeats
MQIKQPSTCEVTKSTIRRLTGQFEVSLALWHVFPLFRDRTDPLDPRSVWACAKTHWPKQVLDEGFPKPTGEFLCFGMAYPPKAAQQGPFEASVSLGSQRRRLAVYGPRVVSAMGRLTEVNAGVGPVAVSAHTAFGGPDFPENELGLGYKALPGSTAPSIEDPNFPIVSVHDAVAPAGFWPLPVRAKVRQQYLGAFDQNWLQSHWPNFPPETDLAFFNTAPLEQRLNGYFRGDESGEILGMNPDRQCFEFQLPGQKARCVFRRSEETNIFSGWSEAPSVAETLYLFPNEGIGALLFRSVITVRRPDALDLQSVIFALEPIGGVTPVQAILSEHFRSELIDPITKPLSDSNASAEPEGLSGESGSAEADSQIKDQHVAQFIKRTTQAGQVKMTLDFELLLSQSGLSEEAQRSIREDSNPFEAFGSALKKQIRQAREEYERALSECGLSEQQYLESLQSQPKVKDAITKSSVSGSISAELDVMLGFIDTMVDTLRQSAKMQMPHTPAGALPDSENKLGAAQSADEGRSQEPGSDESSRMHQFVESRRAEAGQFRGMNLSALRFNGLDLSGLDFTQAICEGTDFSECNLTGACFEAAILTKARFSGAKLQTANLSGIVATQANFDGADLSSSVLVKADLSDTSCVGTCFDDSTLKESNLDQSNLTQAQFKRVQGMQFSANEALLQKTNFSDANLTRVDLIQSELRECNFDRIEATRLDLSGSNLTSCHFVSASMPDTVAMIKPKMTLCSFKETDLSGAAWSTALLADTSFDNCVLKNADFSSGELKNTTFTRCNATGVSFFSCKLDAITLIQSNFMDASFHGAKCVACTWTGNNFFAADFIETSFDDATRMESNVTLKTILPLRGHPTVK